MLHSEILLQKKPLKKSHNSVSLEIFLPFSIRLTLSPFKGLFIKKGIILFQKVLLSVTFLCPDYCSMIFFVVLSNFLQTFLWRLKVFWLFSVLSFKNLFLNPDLFIIVLWSSLVIKGASLARTYFLLIGAYLLNTLKTVSLNVLRSL